MTFSPQPTVDALPIGDVIDRIEKLNLGLASFWSKSHGWAPVAAAGLLGKSRLDWQASLSSSLRIWVKTPANAISPAELILAWTNLGSLVEGSIKTLLSVYYADYAADIVALKTSNVYDHPKQTHKEPDGLGLDKIRMYCKAKDLIGTEGDALVALVQERRNAIHAFKDRPIGTGEEFQNAVRAYLTVLRDISDRLPYPEETYRPRES